MSGRDNTERWARDPIVRLHGGLLTERTSTEAQWWLRDRLLYVFERNVALLGNTLFDGAEPAPTLLVTGSADANALAYRTAGARAVIVHIGLLERLWSVVVRAAHAPTVLSVAEPFTPTDTSNGLTASMDPARWSLPRERVEYFLHVHLFMLEYIVLHEIAHHERGHLQLPAPGSPPTLHDERLARTNVAAMDRSSSRSALRDLEFDADVYAAELALLALDAQFPFDAGQWEEGEASAHAFLYLFAHLLVAQQLDAQTPSSATPSMPHHHPAPVYRAINYSNLLTRALHRLGGGALEIYREAHDQAWTEASFVAELDGESTGIWHGEDFANGLLERFGVDERLCFEAVARLDALTGKSRE